MGCAISPFEISGRMPEAEELLLKHYQPYDQDSILEKMSSAYKVGFESAELMKEDEKNKIIDSYAQTLGCNYLNAIENKRELKLFK